MSSHGSGGGYEPTDAKASPLVVFTVCLAVFTIACFVAGFVMYRMLEKGRDMVDPPLHPMAVQRTIQEGMPRLQITEAADLAKYRREMDAEVDGYGWISREASIVRVPVDRAIELLLKNKELKSRE